MVLCNAYAVHMHMRYVHAHEHRRCACMVLAPGPGARAGRVRAQAVTLGAQCCSQAPCLRPWAATVSVQRPHRRSPLPPVDSRPTGYPGSSGTRSACTANRRLRASSRRADSSRTGLGAGRASTPGWPSSRVARRTCARRVVSANLSLRRGAGRSALNCLSSFSPLVQTWLAA